MVLSNQALEPSELLIFTNNVLERVSTGIRTEQNRKKSDKLEMFPEFLRWPKETLRPILTQMHWKTYPAGSWITRQGRVAPFLAFIVGGSCDVIKTIDMDDEKKDVPRETVRGLDTAPYWVDG